MVKLIQAGFRKDRTILVVFLVIIAIASFILHSGIFASMYPVLYDEYADEYGLADAYISSDADYDVLERALSESDDIDSYIIQDMIELKNIKYTTSRNSKENTANWEIQRYGDNVGCNETCFEKKDDSAAGRCIYISTYNAAVHDWDMGDKIYIDTILGKQEYTVAGIYQNLLNAGLYLVDDGSFCELAEAAVQAGSKPIKTAYFHIKDGTDIDDTIKYVNGKLQNGDNYTYAESMQMSRSGTTVIVNILAGFMAVFALIIMMICMIMIVFTINNNISRDIVNIGVLRAAGYTVRQIRTALTAEYVVIGLIGSAVGTALTYVFFPVMEQAFIREISGGIIWKDRLYPVITFGVLAGVVLFMIAAAYFSTKKIKELHPATALRFGLKSNSFKKNHLPLSETKGELNFLLAMKGSLQNMGQNITIFFIVTAVAFVTMISGLLYYNTKVDITYFQRMIQGDSPDIYVYPEDNSCDSAYRMIDKIREISGVWQAYGLDYVTAGTGGMDVDLIYVTDPDHVYCGIYEGEIMRRDNEVVVGSTVAAKLGVGVGDEITVEYGHASRRYLVTGLQQNIMSSRLYMTDKAAQKLGVDTVYNSLRVRVEEADFGNVDNVISRIEAMDPGISRIRNNFRELRSNDYTPVLAVAMGVYIMVILSIATVVFVIRLLLKTVFIKKEREFGIKKAVGFTSTQLRYQLSLSLMPTTIIAAVAGSSAGYILLDPLFTLILGGYGIRNADLLLQPLLIPVTVVSVTLVMFVFSFIMSRRMKKLSAYKLIQE